MAGGLLASALGTRWTLFLAGTIPVTAGVAAPTLSGRRLAEPAFSEAPA